jgi:hypothetical protein
VLHILFRGKVLQAELILCNFVDISSYPHAFLGLRDLMMFSISFVVENLSCMCGKELLKA